MSLVHFPRAAILAAGRTEVAATSLLHTSQDTHILRAEMSMENGARNFPCPLVERADVAHLFVAVSSPRISPGVALSSLVIAVLGGVGVGHARAVEWGGMGSDVSVVPVSGMGASGVSGMETSGESGMGARRVPGMGTSEGSGMGASN